MQQCGARGASVMSHEVHSIAIWLQRSVSKPLRKRFDTHVLGSREEC